MKRLASLFLAAGAALQAWAQYVPPQARAQQVPQGVAQGAGAPVAGGVVAPPQQQAPMSYPPLQPMGAAPAAAGALPPLPPPAPDLVQMGLDMAAPMTAQEVRKLMEELYRRNSATRENHTGRPPAKPVTSVHTLDLSPGATPPVVRVAVGQGTVLSFADAAGRPWEIVDNINFHGNAYEVKLIAPHLYTIALKEPAAANITVVLKDLPRPIVVTAVPAQNEVDYLVEFTVPRFLGGRPPEDALATAANPQAPSFNAPNLLNYLYRTPPKDAVALKVEGVAGVMAWQNSPTTMVVRTDGLLMLPAWLRRHAATDGMGVYEVPLSPVISIARGGQVLRATVSGFVVDAAAAAASAQQKGVVR